MYNWQFYQEFDESLIMVVWYGARIWPAYSTVNKYAKNAGN